MSACVKVQKERITSVEFRVLTVLVKIEYNYSHTLEFIVESTAWRLFGCKMDILKKKRSFVSL